MEITNFGIYAQLLTSVSGALYLKQTVFREVQPKRISWFIWSFIGIMFSIVAYNDPKTTLQVFLFSLVLAVFPTLIAIVSIWRGINEKITKYEAIAGLLAFSAILFWNIIPSNSGVLPTLILILADACALIPTLVFVYSFPKEDKPIAWICFSIGSILTIISLSEFDMENLSLPLYMAIGSFLVSFPLLRYRLKQKIPLRQWFGFVLLLELFSSFFCLDL
ncbi:hypothetical protein HUU51_04055 [Candidatus Gracilibacteria bacterium]|nr:hypothetical protein [Candidatus Gracilibacteria bacterium]